MVVEAARADLEILPAFAQTTAIDWNQQKAEILRHYRALVQLDTSNPPGNETRVVEYLKKVLEDEGIPTKTFALDPKRANIVARLKGNSSKKPLLILAHSDVVGVQREKWPVDPFGAVLKDGYIWGRGTRDDKPILARRPAPLERVVNWARRRRAVVLSAALVMALSFVCLSISTVLIWRAKNAA